MNTLFYILSASSLVASLGAIYYIFVMGPNKLKTLNNNINNASLSKQELNQAIEVLINKKVTIEKVYYDIKHNTELLKNDFNKLEFSIKNGLKQISSLTKEKEKYESDLQIFKSEIEKLKTSFENYKQKSNQISTEYNSLIEEKKQVQNSILVIQSQLTPLKKEIGRLSERKSDLEQENSHLSLEIAKKNSYRAVLTEYNDTEGDTRAVKYIGYKPNDNFSKNSFPFTSMPNPNSVIKFPRKGRIGLRGFKEPAFEEELKTYFYRQRNLQLFIDRFLIISDKTRPYEPDFVLIDEKTNLNLFIDIEIDEPYDGNGRFATHYKGSDDYRNQYFNDRGWIVIRFTEKQVHENPKGCCRYISKVIESVNNDFSTPEELKRVSIVNNEPFWTKVTAEKWAKENYRENYLGIIGFQETTKHIADTGNLIQNESEKEAENRTLSFDFVKIGPKGKLNEINRHHRDSRIKFFPEPHLYLIDDNPRTISASTLVKQFFQDFDSVYWAERKAAGMGMTINQVIDHWDSNGKIAADLGTQLHLDIENYFENGTLSHHKREFNHFLRFQSDVLMDLKPYRTEWRIFDDLVYVAGTVDMVFKNPDGTYSIFDWKRSKDIKVQNPFNSGIGPCNQLDDCNFNHYCLQLNIYKKILEDYYSKHVSEMFFVQLHPNFDNYILHEVPDMRDTVNQMFSKL